MSKKVKCSKCDKSIIAYNRFKFTFAQKEFVFNGDQNLDSFCLCHKCSRKLSKWLEASSDGNYLGYIHQ